MLLMSLSSAEVRGEIDGPPIVDNNYNPDLAVLEDHKWLVAGDLLFTASSENAVGVESVLAQKKQPVGTRDTLGVRIR